MTVRVPTHKDGKSLYWEFATDGYDVGFGLFFEWVEAEDTQVYRYNKPGRTEDTQVYRYIPIHTDTLNQGGRRILRYTDTLNKGGRRILRYTDILNQGGGYSGILIH